MRETTAVGQVLRHGLPIVAGIIVAAAADQLTIANPNTSVTT